MNRAERRRNSKNTVKAEKTYNVTKKQLEDMLIKERGSATEDAFRLMVVFPVMIVHDYYDELLKAECKEEFMLDKCLELFKTFSAGYMTIDDLKETLKEETGIEIE